MTSGASRRFLGLVFGAAALFATPPAQAQAAGAVRLTAGQVACNRDQLGALLLRSRLATQDGGASQDRPLLLFATYGSAFGAFQGLAVVSQEDRSGVEVGPELQLAFHLDPGVRELLRNPERAPLAQVSLGREDTASTLVSPGSAGALLLRIAPTLDPGHAAEAALLAIDDLEPAAALAAGVSWSPASTRPGRGIEADGLDTACHLRLTEDDLGVLEILQRVVRPALTGPDGGRLDVDIALYRGVEPDTFRIDLYPVAPSAGPLGCRVPLELQAQRTPEGSLGAAELRRASEDAGGSRPCDPEQVDGEVLVVAPPFAGRESWSAADVAAALPIGPSPIVSSASFDFRSVLGATRWNPHRPATGLRCGGLTEAERLSSPRARPSLEFLAATLGEGPAADPRLYERLVADAEAMERARDGLPLPDFSPYVVANLLVAPLDAATFEHLEGDPLFRCLNQAYGAAPELVQGPGSVLGEYAVFIRFRPIVALGAAARDYARVPGLEGVQSASVVYALAPDFLCARWAGPGIFRYWIGVQEEFFESRSAGRVVRLQASEALRQEPWTCEGWQPAVASRGAAPSPPASKIFTVPPEVLTPEEVACTRDRLRALVERSKVLTLDGGLPDGAQALFVSQEDRYGLYDGMVVATPWSRAVGAPATRRPELLLGFHLTPGVRRLLLNPNRLPLDQVALTRETSTSSLVPPGSPRAVQLRLRPTLAAGSGTDPGDLVIDNLAEPAANGSGFRPIDTKPGRGLSEAGLTGICHARFGAGDRRILSILQRTLRVELHDPDRGLRYDARIALFRDRDPGVYGADVYAVDPQTGALLDGSLHLLLEAHPDGAGILRDGRLLVESFDLAGNPRVEGAVSLVRPLFGGVEGAYEPVVSAPVSSPLPAVQDLPFDWAEVLEGTTWNRPVAARECGQGTAEEIRATPREHVDLEELALHIGGGLTASEEVYQRVVADAESIRARFPQASSFGTQAVIYGPLPDVLALTVDEATFRSIEDGTYEAWDCLNDWYGVRRILPDAAAGTFRVQLQLDGIYDLPRLFPEYEALPGVLAADTVEPPTAVAPESNTCGEADGPLFRYYFRLFSPTPPTGSTIYLYFTSLPGQEPTLVESRPAGSPPPPWAVKTHC